MLELLAVVLVAWLELVAAVEPEALDPCVVLDPVALVVSEAALAPLAFCVPLPLFVAEPEGEVWEVAVLPVAPLDPRPPGAPLLVWAAPLVEAPVVPSPPDPQA